MEALLFKDYTLQFVGTGKYGKVYKGIKDDKIIAFKFCWSGSQARLENYLRTGVAAANDIPAPGSEFTNQFDTEYQILERLGNHSRKEFGDKLVVPALYGFHEDGNKFRWLEFEFLGNDQWEGVHTQLGRVPKLVALEITRQFVVLLQHLQDVQRRYLLDMQINNLLLSRDIPVEALTVDTLKLKILDWNGALRLTDKTFYPVPAAHDPWYAVSFLYKMLIDGRDISEGGVRGSYLSENAPRFEMLRPATQDLITGTLTLACGRDASIKLDEVKRALETALAEAEPTPHPVSEKRASQTVVNSPTIPPVPDAGSRRFSERVAETSTPDSTQRDSQSFAAPKPSGASGGGVYKRTIDLISEEKLGQALDAFNENIPEANLDLGELRWRDFILMLRDNVNDPKIKPFTAEMMPLLNRLMQVDWYVEKHDAFQAELRKLGQLAPAQALPILYALRSESEAHHLWSSPLPGIANSESGSEPISVGLDVVYATRGMLNNQPFAVVEAANQQAEKLVTLLRNSALWNRNTVWSRLVARKLAGASTGEPITELTTFQFALEQRAKVVQQIEANYNKFQEDASKDIGDTSATSLKGNVIAEIKRNPNDPVHARRIKILIEKMLEEGRDEKGNIVKVPQVKEAQKFWDDLKGAADLKGTLDVKSESASNTIIDIQNILDQYKAATDWLDSSDKATENLKRLVIDPGAKNYLAGELLRRATSSNDAGFKEILSDLAVWLSNTPNGQELQRDLDSISARMKDAEEKRLLAAIATEEKQLRSAIERAATADAFRDAQQAIRRSNIGLAKDEKLTKIMDMINTLASAVVTGEAPESVHARINEYHNALSKDGYSFKYLDTLLKQLDEPIERQKEERRKQKEQKELLMQQRQSQAARFAGVAVVVIVVAFVALFFISRALQGVGESNIAGTSTAQSIAQVATLTKVQADANATTTQQAIVVAANIAQITNTAMMVAVNNTETATAQTAIAVNAINAQATLAPAQTNAAIIRAAETAKALQTQVENTFVSRQTQQSNATKTVIAKTPTVTPTLTPSKTPTATRTSTPTITRSPTVTLTFTPSNTPLPTSEKLTGDCTLKIAGKTQLVTWPAVDAIVVINIDFNYTFNVLERYIDDKKAECYRVKVESPPVSAGSNGWVKTSSDNAFFQGNCQGILIVVPPTRTPSNTPSRPTATMAPTKTITPTRTLTVTRTLTITATASGMPGGAIVSPATQIPVCQLKVIAPRGVKLRTDHDLGAKTESGIIAEDKVLLPVQEKLNIGAVTWHRIEFDGVNYWVAEKDRDLTLVEIQSPDDCRGLPGFPPVPAASFTPLPAKSTIVIPPISRIPTQPPPCQLKIIFPGDVELRDEPDKRKLPERGIIVSPGDILLVYEKRKIGDKIWYRVEFGSRPYWIEERVGNIFVVAMQSLDNCRDVPGFNGERDPG